MNTNDHEAPDRNRQMDDADLGPEPDWLTDDVAAPEEPDQPAPEMDAAPRRERVTEPIVLAPSRDEPIEASATAYRATGEPIEVEAITPTRGPLARGPKPWMLWGIPLGLTAVLAMLAWWGSTRGLNHLTTWSALRFEHPGLLPARWTMFMWWVVLALVAGFLIYSAMPAGRAITRIGRTGPLVAVALIATSIWLFAVHWNWEGTAIITMVIALGTLLASYLMVALNPDISRMWQRAFSVIPLSAAVGFTLMLLVISWQGYSAQPLGNRGTSLLLLLLLVIVAAVFAFFVRDGVISLVFAIWFLGVAQHQWGDDTVISISAIVALMLTAATAAMGFILAVESHRPSLTAQITDERGTRIRFLRKSGNPSSERLPQ